MDQDDLNDPEVLDRRLQKVEQMIADTMKKAQSAWRASEKAEQKLRSLVPDTPTSQAAVGWYRHHLTGWHIHRTALRDLLDEQDGLEHLKDQASS